MKGERVIVIPDPMSGGGGGGGEGGLVRLGSSSPRNWYTACAGLGPPG
jgi:hypothetical protein